MDIRLLEATEGPEELICTAARNDYLDYYFKKMQNRKNRLTP